MKKQTKKVKKIKGFGLFEDGELCRYYGLHFIRRTLKGAEIERDYYNKKLGHRMKISEVEIIIKK